MSSDSASSNGSASESDSAQVTTRARTRGDRRNPVHYTDGQIVKMIGATATANPYGAPHGSKKKAWEAAVTECNKSGLFPFEVTIKGLKDKITSLLHSHEKPRKTKFGATQSRTYDSEIDNLRKIRQIAETNKESTSARKFQRAQRLEREGQIAREAALHTFTESQSAEREQSLPANEDQTPGASPSPPREPSPNQPHRHARNRQDGNQDTITNADPTAVIRQLVKSTRQINQSEGARFERMHGNLATSTEILQDISEHLKELKAIGEETNTLLRSAIPQPPPPVFGYSYAPHIDTPGAGPGPSTQGQKRRRTESPDNA